MKKYTSEFFDKLYSFGFIYSEDCINSNEYPFYDKWNSYLEGRLLCSPKIKCFFKEYDNFKIALIGHAYNPFTLDYNENVIIDRLAEKAEGFLDYLNQLTGVFTIIIFQDDNVYLFGDATGMQSSYYGYVKNKVCISSHAGLIGEVFSLNRSEYINRLVNYKYFPLLGCSLPGDLSEFDEIKRLIPNHYVVMANNHIRTKRFYYPKVLSCDNIEIIHQVSNLLSNGLSLICKKWKNPAISMTGGCDSKTTLACVGDNYSKFKYFSYESSKEEGIDCAAAKKIADALGLKHKSYIISEDDGRFENIEIHRDILFKNAGCMRKTNLNDVRKRVYFSKLNDFDVEVKSWASEVGRAYYSKRFNNKKNFGKITARKLTTLYKFFLNNRKLVYDTDKIFKGYISNYLNFESDIPWQEVFFWEFRMSSWNGNVITGEHRYSFDITIPYNNRILLNLLLSAPIKDRIEDKIYNEIRKIKNPLIDEVGVSVVNVKHTKKRAVMENVYYTIHSKFPF